MFATCLARVSVFVTLLTTLALAAPNPTIRDVAAVDARATWTDPAFSVSTSTLAASVTCPNGIQGKAGGIVFLVHGTAGSATDTWTNGPYYLILPTLGPGYDICWVQLPGDALGNAATAAEYVAYNIPVLAKKSATGKVFLVGYSQGGGLNIPWALDFFPSTVPYVAGFIGISADFHGTSLGGIACFGLGVLESGYCPEAIWQQAETSQAIKVIDKNAASALVGTTSIFTIYDEIIPPEPYDSTLTGAINILIQDLCGVGHVVDHVLAPFDSGYFGVAVNALLNGGKASTSTFDTAYCTGFKGNTLVNPTNAAAVLKAAVDDVLNVLTISSPYVSTKEPPLPEYVCTRYPTAGFTCATGTLNK